MKVVVAPDKFKGSLTAVQAAEAMADGLRRGQSDVEVLLVPVADGGEGTVDAAVSAGYQRLTVPVQGPTGQVVLADFALRGQSAVLEMAEASGLRRLPAGRVAPLTASTYGTGQLLLAALDAGARSVVLGAGGSATTDGGAGMAQALGARLLDESGRQLPPGGAALLHLHRIDVQSMDRRLAATSVVLASDVDNPLLGGAGAAAVFGPQKGATPHDVERLDGALRRFALVLHRDLGVTVDRMPGAGAAGGTGAGALAFLSARITSGIALVLDVVGFPKALIDADLVLTGEGSFDAQSLSGKAPVGVARAAMAVGVPVIALVGRLDVTPGQLRSVGISSARSLLELEPDIAVAIREAQPLLAHLAVEVARTFSECTLQQRRAAATGQPVDR